MPAIIKPVPNNQWAWESQDKIHTAHAIVRQQSMPRQTQLHDLQTSYETFINADQVFVFFTVKLIGIYTQFLRSPF